MSSLAQFLQSGIGKEKNMFRSFMPRKVKADEMIEIKLSVGDAIKHPNTLEHHIAWFKLFYFPEGGKFPVELGDFKFSAHGEGESYTEPVAVANIQLKIRYPIRIKLL